MAEALPEFQKTLKSMCRERFVLRQSRLHSGLAQVFLVLFALAILAPTFDVPLTGMEAEAYVSAPDDPQGDATVPVGTTLSVAEDLEEEPDQDEVSVLAVAWLHCSSDAGHQAADGWLPSFPRPFAQSCTGPPTL
ncbi:hypothetical protein [Inquilinus limosus]|uniref:Uncharacterized protein n=1 Tax=Inquilinus limosus TaxID=171674 RepID=A0A211ZHH7_9PROT|nr:hypothetical protein [Inquilinus limosus]OWJ64732.1 hypothetical protein BWR60_23360 [Inquilinus limosus]